MAYLRASFELLVFRIQVLVQHIYSSLVQITLSLTPRKVLHTITIA